MYYIRWQDAVDSIEYSIYTYEMSNVEYVNNILIGIVNWHWHFFHNFFHY